jgi:hypothetical protein
MQQKFSLQRTLTTNSDRQKLSDGLSVLRRKHSKLSDEELLHLEESLDWYFEFALRIYSRLHPPRRMVKSGFDDGIPIR